MKYAAISSGTYSSSKTYTNITNSSPSISVTNNRLYEVVITGGGKSYPHYFLWFNRNSTSYYTQTSFSHSSSAINASYGFTGIKSIKTTSGSIGTKSYNTSSRVINLTISNPSSSTSYTYEDTDECRYSTCDYYQIVLELKQFHVLETVMHLVLQTMNIITLI